MKTLIIDDDPKIHEMFKSFLPFEYKIEPDSAYSAEEGIEKLSEKHYDFVICDYHMPPKTGMDVLNYIEKLNEKPIVIMLTASDEKELLLKSVDVGVYKYIEKTNFSLDLITEIMEDVISCFEDKKNKKHFSSLGENLAVVIHEINNPLSVIQMRTHVLKGKKFTFNNDKEKEDYLKHLNSITDSCHKITSIMNEQRDQIVNLKIEEIGLNTLFLELEDFIDVLNLPSDINVDVSELNKDIEIITNKYKISQVLTNLINNSLDAISDLNERWIKLKVDLSDNLCTISCIDSGNGIPDEVQEKIFQKFYSKKKDMKGTGMGLHICKSIANDLGGDLVLDNSSKNTKFVLTFPMR